eukprot:Seg1474.10 transcript_id=Seg1474.10/GoldUCD/mRNA.D3Y31 product="Transmembrane emp24 domain-containing protein 7" protein_id=Seg1474.10/GoldUCD/D3Y31
MKTSTTEALCLAVLWGFLAVVQCTELTFELEDNAKQCFYEVIKKDTKSTLEFQVVTGGHYDVDVTLKDPNGKLCCTSKQDAGQFRRFSEAKQILGEYVFCFGNEFSSFAHKTVYLDFQAGEEAPLVASMGKHHTALTQLETSASNIHEALKVVIDYQTHHRLREMTGRDEAEYLNERVQYWSIGQTVTIVVVSLLQPVAANLRESRQQRLWRMSEYTFCFGNEFSSFSHKTVYFDMQNGEAPSRIPNIDANLGAMTQLETASANIHESLKIIIDYQTHYKLRMATGRSVAEYLFDRIKYWSLGQTLVIVAVAGGQVYMLRNFFADKKENI